MEDGGARQQRDREVAEELARDAAETGGAYEELLAKGARYASKVDPRREAKAYREAIALRPDNPTAYTSTSVMRFGRSAPRCGGLGPRSCPGELPGPLNDRSDACRGLLALEYLKCLDCARGQSMTMWTAHVDLFN